MAAISSLYRSDPVAFFQRCNHPKIVSKIFQDMTNPSDWYACSLVNKRWMRVNAEGNPRKVLVRAIDGNDLDVVVALLDQGLSPNFRIKGSRFVSGTEDTPYLRAKSRHHDQIASVLKKKDGAFSEEMVKKKLDCLRFDLANLPFSVQGQIFQQHGTGGVGHEFHHEYLLPDVIQSFKTFSAQRADTDHWNQAKSEQIATALERSLKICPSCSLKS